MTKEDILDSVCDGREETVVFDFKMGYDFADVRASTIFKAMDKYAKQESLKFANWLHENYYYPVRTSVSENVLWEKPVSEKRYQTEHLYNRFNKQK